jgi:hypothetical protein
LDSVAINKRQVLKRNSYAGEVLGDHPHRYLKSETYEWTLQFVKETLPLGFGTDFAVDSPVILFAR